MQKPYTTMSHIQQREIIKIIDLVYPLTSDLSTLLTFKCKSCHFACFLPISAVQILV